ncbi:MAG: S8 family serine peptidase [Pseudomonadota bacterium]
MNTTIRLIAVIAAVLVALGSNPASAEKPAPEFENAWVVVLDDPRPPRRRGWSSGSGYGGQYAYDQDPALKRLAERIAEDYAVDVEDQWPIRRLGVHCLVVKIDENLEQVLDNLRADARVQWVQPLNEFSGMTAIQSVDDPYRELQPSLDAMHISAVRETATGRGVTIAIIDSGVETDHPDLAHAVIANEDFVGRGRSAEHHGTGVAGVVVAARGNDEGIAGVAPNAGLYAFRACWDSDNGGTSCNSLTLSRALERAADAAPHVVNLSLTGPPDPLLEALLTEILAAGSIVVVADSNSENERFPAERDGIVWATTDDGQLSSVRVSAPGRDVLTAQPGHGYDFMSGSSISAAHVTGVIALLHETMPMKTDRELLIRLSESRDGVGRLNACFAVLGPSHNECQSAD